MKVPRISSKGGLDDDDEGTKLFLGGEDSAHCHFYNSNMDDFSYLGYNGLNMRHYLAGIG